MSPKIPRNLYKNFCLLKKKYLTTKCCFENILQNVLSFPDFMRVSLGLPDTKQFLTKSGGLWRGSRSDMNWGGGGERKKY